MGEEKVPKTKTKETLFLEKLLEEKLVPKKATSNDESNTTSTTNNRRASTELNEMSEDLCAYEEMFRVPEKGSLTEVQAKKARNALKTLSPGKKAILESLFSDEDGMNTKDLAERLQEPEEKILRLKANALRGLIYKLT